jgi:transcriptional regulator with PAS, ATPase and Fis domain
MTGVTIVAPLILRCWLHISQGRYAAQMGKLTDEVSPSIMDALVRHSWPGNIRELQNFIERSVPAEYKLLLTETVAVCASAQSRALQLLSYL